MQKVGEGDFVKLSDVVGKTASGDAFEESPKDKGFLVVAGKRQLIKGLDDALLGGAEGESRKIRIPKEKAFGPRREELVRLIPLQRFKEQNINPVPGLPLQLDGMNARVQSVSGGRVRVDFNHELAGQDLDYEYKITGVYKTDEDKIRALAEDCGFKAELKDGTARIKSGGKEKKDAEFVRNKLRFIQTALQYIPEVKKVVFEEEYEKPSA